LVPFPDRPVTSRKPFWTRRGAPLASVLIIMRTPFFMRQRNHLTGSRFCVTMKDGVPQGMVCRAERKMARKTRRSPRSV
jgi:hypothetical protein